MLSIAKAHDNMAMGCTHLEKAVPAYVKTIDAMLSANDLPLIKWFPRRTLTDRWYLIDRPNKGAPFKEETRQVCLKCDHWPEFCDI